MGEGIYIKYFMWSHQHSTLDNIQRYAENLFKEISPKLKPKVFLLGIRRKEIESKYIRYPICMQPEDCGIDVKLFDRVDELANSIHEKDFRRRIFTFTEYLQQNHEDDVKRDSVRSAVQQLVNENFIGKNIVSFVSKSVELEGYEIFVVFQIDVTTYNSFYGLAKKNRLSRISLFDSLIWTFLDESLQTLYRPGASTRPQSIYTDTREVLRIAASDFVRSAIYTVCESKGWMKFLNACNYISSLKYEGGSSIGRIIVCRQNHPNLDIYLKLITPVQLSEYRKVRKLLEIASRDLALYSDGFEILGLGRTKGEYDTDREDLLMINFNGHYKWEMFHGDHQMLIVEHTNPSLPKLKIHKEVFDDLLKRMFNQIPNENLERLWKIVDIATMQKHGALLIISNEAEKESKRLENQSTRIEPTMLNESLIRNVTSIDGAVLLDSMGVCHSIGVILDGVATEKGRSDRGARYNSAIRYVENNKMKCVAVIISEDGMVDLYPILLPQIRHSEIEKHLDELRIIHGEELLDDDRYWSVMRWLTQHEFYLSQEQCDEINELKLACNKKERKDPHAAFFFWDDLAPKAGMDNSYFVNEQ
jgi:hypothetical protein